MLDALPKEHRPDLSWLPDGDISWDDFFKIVCAAHGLHPDRPTSLSDVKAILYGLTFNHEVEISGTPPSATVRKVPRPNRDPRPETPRAEFTPNARVVEPWELVERIEKLERQVALLANATV